MVTPCTGTLEGTWFYSTACGDDPLADMRQYCSSVSTVSSTSSLSGRLDFTGTHVSRQVTTTYLTTVNLPSSCASFGCSTIEAALQNSIPTASCSSAGGARTGCDCTVSGTSTLSEAGTWTSSGGVLTVVTPSLTRTFDSCVTAGAVPSLQLRETTSSLTGTEQGTTTLSHR
jgi:hypothetical protein